MDPRLYVRCQGQSDTTTALEAGADLRQGRAAVTRAAHGGSTLAGDVGGTKTEPALFAGSGSGLREIRARTFPSREYTSLEGIVGAFLETEPAGSVAAACFGVAGPVRGGKAKITNLPWELEEEALARTMGGPRGRLLNGLPVAGYRMRRLAA